jgi:O-antigen ligase
VPIGVYLFSQPKLRRWIIDAFCVGVLIVSIYGVVQHFAGVNWFKSWELTEIPGFGYAASGNFSHRLTFANYYAVAAFFLLGYTLSGWRNEVKWRRPVYLSAIVVAVLATSLSYSRGPLVAMIAGLLLYGLLVGRKQLTYAIGIGVAAVMAVVILLPGLADRFADNFEREIAGEYEGSRIFIWRNTGDIVKEHPFLGVGQGNFAPEYEARLRPDIGDERKHVHAHNDIFNIAAIAGIPGAIFFVGIWLSLFVYLVRMRRKYLRAQIHNPAAWERLRFCTASLLGSAVFFVSALTEATFADEEVRQLLMFVWAAGLWTTYKQSSDQSAAPSELS